MRHKTPEYGNKRTKSGFLWLPKTAYYGNGRQEMRWLERATWEEKYSYVENGWATIRWEDA